MSDQPNISPFTKHNRSLVERASNHMQQALKLQAEALTHVIEAKRLLDLNKRQHQTEQVIQGPATPSLHELIIPKDLP